MIESEHREQSRDRGLKFTPSGLKRMEEYQTKFAQVLRRSIREQRLSFTGEVVEITAADVDRALNGVKLISTQKLHLRRLIYDIYGIFGLSAALIGLFYDKVQIILLQEPIRLTLIGVGLFILLGSLLGRRLYKIVSIERDPDGISFFSSDMEDIWFNKHMVVGSSAADAERAKIIYRYRMMHEEIDKALKADSSREY